MAKRKKLTAKQRVLKKYPHALLCLASAGYDVRGSGSQLHDELGWGSTPHAAWANAATRLGLLDSRTASK